MTLLRIALLWGIFIRKYKFTSIKIKLMTKLYPEIFLNKNLTMQFTEPYCKPVACILGARNTCCIIKYKIF